MKQSLQGKMIALDLDGTLTNSEKKITPRTRAALMKAQEAGARLILASGRPIFGVRPLAAELEMDRHGGLLLSFNGGRTIDCETGEVMFEETIDPALYPEIYEACRPYDGMVLMTYDDTCILTEHPDDRYVQEEAWINQIEARNPGSLKDYVDFPVVKFLGGGDPEYLEQIEADIAEKLAEHFDVYRSAPFFLEILPKGVDKGNCLRRMFEARGFSAEDLIAFGDGYNDLTMLGFAGHAIAMGNSVPPALAAADDVTGTNDEDGIAQALERWYGIRV